MKMVDHRVTFSEVPDEVTLTFWISNCPRECPGCQTPFLSQDIGMEIDQWVLKGQIDRQLEHITCVCFLGGEQHEEEFEKLIDFIRLEYPGLKVALYTGADSVADNIFWKLDYVKVGPYIEELGGLSSKCTNQNMWEIEGNERMVINTKFQEAF